MRIVVTSDLQYTHERRPAVEAIRDEIGKLSPDVLVVAGNIGYPIGNFDSALRLFSNFRCAKAAILGNRDIWTQVDGSSSEILWTQLLPKSLDDSGFSYLESANLKVGPIGLCGTSGWYDYSGRDNKLRYTIEQYRELKGLVNFDSQYIDWTWSDQDLAATLQASFAKRIDMLERDRDVSHIVVVTHFPVFVDAVIHRGDDPQWNFGSAYAFNLALGRAIAPRNKLRHVVSGHVATGGAWTLTFGTNSFVFHVVGRNESGPRLAVIEI